MIDFLVWLLAVTVAEIVALVFLLAGIGKLFDRSATTQHIERYGLLPLAVARLTAAVLPVVELAIAASLLTGFGGRLGATLALALLMLFSLAQTIVLVRGREVLCGCFGSLSAQPVRWRHVLNNLVLAACCLLATRAFPEFFSLQLISDTQPDGAAVSLSPSEVVVVQLMIVVLVVQSLSLWQVLENRAYEREQERSLRELSAAASIQRIGLS